MCVQPFRLPAGGLIDRSSRLAFYFNGVRLVGHEGDTLGSALSASGLRLKPQHRLGPESLIHGFAGGYAFPVRLVEGLEAGRRPAGSPAQRHAAVKDSFAPDLQGKQDIRTLYCDVAVIGGGAAGITAALVAAATGAKVILTEQASMLGGWLLNERRSVDHRPAQLWVSALAGKIYSYENILVCLQTTAIDVNANGTVNAFARWPDNPAEFKAAPEKNIHLLKICAKRTIVATGTGELGLDFEDSNKAGVYLSSAVRGYLNQYAVACARQMLIATNNDSGYLTAFDLAEAGLNIAGIVDGRRPARSFIHEHAEHLGISVLFGSVVRRIRHRGALEAAEIMSHDGSVISVLCDGLAVAGGLVPVLDVLNRIVTAAKNQLEPCLEAGTISLAGSCAGAFALQACLSSAAEAGADAAMAAGYACNRPWVSPRIDPLLNIQRVTPHRGEMQERNWCIAVPHDLTPYKLSGGIQSRDRITSKQIPNPGTLYGAAALGLLTRIDDF